MTIFASLCRLQDQLALARRNFHADQLRRYVQPALTCFHVNPHMHMIGKASAHFVISEAARDTTKDSAHRLHATEGVNHIRDGF